MVDAAAGREGPDPDGLFVAVGAGVVATTERGDALRRAVQGLIRRLAPEPTLRLDAPPVIPARIVERAQYLAAFPHLLGGVRAFAGQGRDLLRLLRAADRGEDWSGALGPTGLVLPPAACHLVYDMYADSTMVDTVVEVRARCFRHEPSAEPGRLQSFEMHEVVCIGSADTVRAFAATGLAAATAVVEALGLSPRTVAATDPFFGTMGSALAEGQRTAGSKSEVEVDLGHRPLAVASVNRHAGHFGELFGITVDGQMAHSACVAFGIERLMVAVAAEGPGAIDRSIEADR